MSVISAAAPLLEPLDRPETAGAFAYARIREAIVSLDLQPGAALSRAALATRLSLSQTPVREALLRLQSEGLVEVIPSASTRVALIDLRSVHEAHVLRVALELELVHCLATDAPASLAPQLAASLERQHQLLETDDQDSFTQEDDAFHRLLYEAGQTAGLWRLVRDRSGHLDRLRRLHLPAPGKAAAILKDHEALARAILDGRTTDAVARLRAHLAETLGRVDAIRAEHPAFFAPP